MPCETRAESLARLRRHVENEVPEAITRLGSAYRHGLYGLVKSDKKAAKIWKRAVELGNVNAMNNLGTLYENGSGVKLDKKQAMKLYRAAADRGDAISQYNLGYLLDAEKKFDESFRYYALSADQGYTAAEHILGICYRLGEGTEVDLSKARYWFERAAAKGYERAIKSLARLDARV
jgi:TPR repeat protein